MLVRGLSIDPRISGPRLCGDDNITRIIFNHEEHEGILLRGFGLECFKSNTVVSPFRVYSRWVWISIRVMILPVLLLSLAPVLGGIALIGAISRAIFNGFAKKKGFYKKSKFRFAVRVIGWVLLFAGGIFLNTDAPPLENDYTIEDLRSAGPENDYSFELLKSLAVNEKTDLPDVIGMAVEDANAIEALDIFNNESDLAVRTDIITKNEEILQRAWKSALRGRKAIEILSEFDEIADLTEPRVDVELDYISGLKYLNLLYSSYVMLQCEKGNSIEAVRELIKIDQMFRKLSVNCRTVIGRIVCIAGIAKDINSANYISNHPKTSPEALKLLSEHFAQITEDQISMRNVIISEYLIFKNEIEMMKVSRTEYESWCLTKRRILKVNSSKIAYLNTLNKYLNKQNLTHKEEYSLMQARPLISNIMGEVKLIDEDEFPRSYYYYNPMGSMLAMVMLPSMEKVYELHTKLQIRDDLFQIVIGMRLGRKVDLSARAYGDEYVVDLDAEIIYSPGKDGEAFTDDDIKLYIDPAVLRLK